MNNKLRETDSNNKLTYLEKLPDWHIQSSQGAKTRYWPVCSQYLCGFFSDLWGVCQLSPLLSNHRWMGHDHEICGCFQKAKVVLLATGSVSIHCRLALRPAATYWSLCASELNLIFTMQNDLIRIYISPNSILHCHLIKIQQSSRL